MSSKLPKRAPAAQPTMSPGVVCKPAALGAPPIYVLWHPRCEFGAGLATTVFNWIRKNDGFQSIRGSETPVYYRSSPWLPHLDLPDGASLDARRPIGTVPPRQSEPDLQFPCRPYNTTDASGVVVLALVDEHMICDPDWRAHLYSLAGLHDQTRRWLDAGERNTELDHHLLLVPVELSAGYPQLHPALSGINPIRLLRWDEGKLDGDQKQQLRTQRLRRHLTQVLVRHYRELERKELRLPRAVFLSHATSDGENGVGVAEAIQREALNLGQVDTFLNTTTLDWGKPWEARMMGAAGEDAAALVAIVGDNYASRPWCRREIQAARRLRELNTSMEAYRVWWSQPAVIVDTLVTRWTRMLPEFSGLPVVRWESALCAARALDQLMLEALQTLVHARYIMELAPSAVSSVTPHYLAVSPDPYTLMDWQRNIQCNEHAVVVYPGHRMLPEDESRLKSWFGERVRFLSLDDVVDAVARNESLDDLKTSESKLNPNRRRGLVALATGDAPAEELAALGVGVEHVHEALFQFVRALLLENQSVAHSGCFKLMGDLLDPLLDIADASEATAREAEEMADWTPMVRVYAGWPESLNIDANMEARRLARCSVVRFDAHDKSGLPDAIRRADSLSEMRRRLAFDCDVALVVGGDLGAYAGWFPGVIEIAAECALAGKPVLPMAMFGGAARQLVRWLLTDTSTPAADWMQHWPGAMREDLRDATQADLASIRLMHGYRARLANGLDTLRTQVNTARSTDYAGIPWDAVEKIMRTDSVRIVRRLLRWSVLPKVAMVDARLPSSQDGTKPQASAWLGA